MLYYLTQISNWSCQYIFHHQNIYTTAAYDLYKRLVSLAQNHIGKQIPEYSAIKRRGHLDLVHQLNVQEARSFPGSKSSLRFICFLLLISPHKLITVNAEQFTETEAVPLASFLLSKWEQSSRLCTKAR
jgi:hypothetical protein